LRTPATTHELYLWNGGLLIGYIVVAAILETIYRQSGSTGTGLKPSDYLFNGATFSASITIAMGICDETVLHLIGDTTGYLILGGVAGLGYSFLALIPKTLRERFW
jgi:hypothetical protein